MSSPYQHVCVVCAEQFGSTRPEAMYCRPLCARRAYAARRRADGRRAKVDRQSQARRTEYNRENRNRWGAEKVCEACGKTWKTLYPERRTCSRQCGGYIRAGRWPQSPVPDSHPSRSSLIPPEHPSRQPRPRLRFAMGYCRHCGQAFVTDRLACYNLTTVYCSTRCTTNAHKKIRRARKVGAYVADVRRTEIFERDAWTCQLCGEPIERDTHAPHPWAPTIDHIVPLTRGGTHEPANVQAAHFWCNTVKGDRADFTFREVS